MNTNEVMADAEMAGPLVILLSNICSLEYYDKMRICCLTLSFMAKNKFTLTWMSLSSHELEDTLLNVIPLR